MSPKRKYLEAARWQARDRLLEEFDWRDLAASETATVRPVRPVRAAEDIQKLNPVQKEIVRLTRQGLQPKHLATLFGLSGSDAEVELLLFGEAGTA